MRGTPLCWILSEDVCLVCSCCFCFLGLFSHSFLFIRSHACLFLSGPLPAVLPVQVGGAGNVLGRRVSRTVPLLGASSPSIRSSSMCLCVDLELDEVRASEPRLFPALPPKAASIRSTFSDAVCADQVRAHVATTSVVVVLLFATVPAASAKELAQPQAWRGRLVARFVSMLLSSAS